MKKYAVESKFQAHVKKRLEETFEGCIVLKQDTRQGFPDLLILHNDKWATLECKRSAHESKRPNQEYYVNLTNEMSFSRFIYPENEEAIFYELQQAFQS